MQPGAGGGMLGRWQLYFRETVKPAGSIAAVSLTVVGILCMFQALLGRGDLVLTGRIVPTVAIYFFLLLYWRGIDEFKDRDVDRRFFPERPVPSGRVRLKDLKVLLWTSSTLMFVVCILSGLPLVPLFFIFLYEVLQGRWFFLERRIANNRLLAFATHAPSAFLFNGYVIAVTCRHSGIALFRWETLFVAAWFSLPFFAHEFARKTRAPSEEREGYQTYSAMIGFRGSAALCAALVLLHEMMLLAASGSLRLSTPWLSLTGLLALAYAAVFAAFAASPEGRSRFLRPATELYLLLVFLGTTADLALSHGVRWG